MTMLKYKVFLVFVLATVVDCIMVPIYDIPSRPPYPDSHSGYHREDDRDVGYYPTGGYNVKENDRLIRLAPVGGHPSFGGESREFHPQAYHYPNYY